MYDNDSELYNEFLKIYFDEYKFVSDAQKSELGNKYDPTLFLEKFNNDIWFEK